MSEAGEEKRDSTSKASSIERRRSERRRHLRFQFIATVEAIDLHSHAKLSGRVTDLGFGGCYVDTINPLVVGTVIKIRLTKEKFTFEAEAKVIFSHAGMGMGVAFISAMPRQLRIFQKWLNELAGKSLPELEQPEETEADAIVANSTKHPDFVLRELLIALMRKGVLTEVEGKAMIQKLYR
jgi:hypothetical protein